MRAETEAMRKVFGNIPVRTVLSIAREVQRKLKTDNTLRREKLCGEIVTLADTRIQQLLLKYFSGSPIAGTYVVKSEEETEGTNPTGKERYQLLVDPLDGTSAFAKDADTWGTMVGLCDSKGILQYSWNLLSTGEIFSTGNTSAQSIEGFTDKISKGKKLRIDVYDYGSDVSQGFGRVLEEALALLPGQYEQTSYPSAVWAGGQIEQGNLDGLLWLPSELGKKWYPDYDLIFLGSIEQRGYKVRLGKIDGKNAMVVVAPTNEDADTLYTIGLQLLSDKQRERITLAENALQITDAI